MPHTDKFFIGGAWRKPAGIETIDVINPATEEVIASIPAGTPEDVDAAVKAAREAFPAWSRTSPAERADYLDAICDGLEARTDELVETIMAELGMPRGMVKELQVGLPLTESRFHAASARTFEWDEIIGNSVVIREGVGVVAAITPWNYPLLQIMRKVAPALVTGCTVVVKPSEVTPLNALILAEVVEAVALPAGVFNVVTGYGSAVGEALASHPDVDMISLTGSTRAGHRVSELAAPTVKRLALELGGKSPMIVLDDADMDKAVEGALNSCYLNSGQSCSALTRMLVPRSRVAEAEEDAVRASAQFVVGSPSDDGVTIGPLVSEVQKGRVLALIQKGVDEGARLVLDGRDGAQLNETGYFVRPTVFSDVKPGMTIEQEEIFGPVLSIVAYDSEEEAIDIANGTVYGLAAAVWSSDSGRARGVASQIRAGQIEINGGQFNPLAPFGGYKQSGRGRENGRFGFEEFLEVKSLQL